MHAVLECMVADEVSGRGRAAALTAALSSHLGVAGGVALSDPAAAVAAAYAAAGLVRGSRLIMSALAPAIYVQVAQQRGVVPLLADVDPHSGGVRIDAVQSLLAVGANAILLTHTAGGRDDPELSTATDVPVIEEMTGRWRDAGAEAAPLGDVLLVSLEDRSLITAGGGMAVLGRNRRLQRSIAAAAQAQPAGELPDINAALALAQLPDAATFVELRGKQSELFAAALATSRHSTFAGVAAAAPMAFPVLVQSGLKEVRRYAAKHGVRTEPGYRGCAFECFSVDTEAEGREQEQGVDPARADNPVADVASSADSNPAAPGTSLADGVQAAAAAPLADGIQAAAAAADTQSLRADDLPNLPDVLRRQLEGGDESVVGADWSAARTLSRQCVLFPLYPSLPEESVQRIAKVLATLP